MADMTKCKKKMSESENMHSSAETSSPFQEVRENICAPNDVIYVVFADMRIILFSRQFTACTINKNKSCEHIWSRAVRDLLCALVCVL
jgi:hypothetical protein